MSVCLHVKCRYNCQIAMKLEFYRQIFEKHSDTKFRENLSGGDRLVPCGWTDGQTDRRTDRHAEARSPFSNFEKAPNNFEFSLLNKDVVPLSAHFFLLFSGNSKFWISCDPLNFRFES